MKNPPAFPRPYFEAENGEHSTAQEGMSLRDWFAGQSLAVLANPDVLPMNDQDAVYVADNAYKIADAMLVARTRGQS